MGLLQGDMMTQIFEYTIYSDDFDEIDSLERAFLILDATKINHEGWPTAYGGTGITLWAETTYPKKTIRQILKVTAAKLRQCRAVNK